MAHTQAEMMKNAVCGFGGKEPTGKHASFLNPDYPEKQRGAFN